MFLHLMYKVKSSWLIGRETLKLNTSTTFPLACRLDYCQGRLKCYFHDKKLGNTKTFNKLTLTKSTVEINGIYGQGRIHGPHWRQILGERINLCTNKYILV